MLMSPKIEIQFTPPVDQSIDQLLTTIGFGFNPGEMKRACRLEVFQLQAKSDAELRLLGLTRDKIVAHVLRRKFPCIPD